LNIKSGKNVKSEHPLYVTSVITVPTVLAVTALDTVPTVLAVTALDTVTTVPAVTSAYNMFYCRQVGGLFLGRVTRNSLIKRLAAKEIAKFKT
jgi:hypothetical protein